MNRASLSDGKVCLAVARRTALVWLHSAKRYIWWRRDYGVGLFFRSWTWPLSSSERKSECFSIPRDVGQFHAHNFVGTVWGWPFLFQHDCAPEHKVRSIKTWMREFGVDKLGWPAQSPNLNLTEHLWDELEWILRARPSHPTSVCDLTEWSEIPINTLLNLVESLPRRVEAVIATKGGPMSY